MPTNQNNLFNKSSVDVQCSLSYSTNCMFWLLNEISSVTGSMWCMRNQSNRSTTFISDIFQGILWMNDITIPWHLKMRSTYDLTDAKQKQVVRSYQPRQSDFCLIILEKWRKFPKRKLQHLQQRLTWYM